jgi:hypothetical protein
MFANTQMMGCDVNFPDVSAKPQAPAPSPENQPAPPASSGGMFGGILGQLSSFLPHIDPSVMGGLAPGIPQLGRSMPNLPTSFLPHF